MQQTNIFGTFFMLLFASPLCSFAHLSALAACLPPTHLSLLLPSSNLSLLPASFLKASSLPLQKSRRRGFWKGRGRRGWEAGRRQGRHAFCLVPPSGSISVIHFTHDQWWGGGWMMSTKTFSLPLPPPTYILPFPPPPPFPCAFPGNFQAFFIFSGKGLHAYQKGNH